MPRRKVNFEMNSPFRRPDWRNQRVMRILDGSRNRCDTSDDQFIKDLRKYRTKIRKNPDPAKRREIEEEMGPVAWADRIFSGREDRVLGRRACMIECRILAKQTNEEIAEEVGGTVEMVEYYEALFFDIRDRYKAHDWILGEILVPSFDHAMQAGPNNAFNAQNGPSISLPYFDATLRFFAYYGGPLVYDFAASGFRRDSQIKRREQTGLWFDDSWLNRVRQRSGAAAHGFEINKYNVVELFAVHAKIIEIIRAKDDEHKKQSDINQAVTAMVSGMTWAIGTPADVAANRRLAKEEKTAFILPSVELRDDELALVNSGSRLDHLDELQDMVMPAPNRRTEEPTSVDTK